MSKWIVLFVALLIVVAIIASLLARARRKSDHESTWPFIAKRVLSVPEQVLYHRLVKALPDHVVLAQVQLSRFIGISRGRDDRQSWFNRISQLSADFVICGKDFNVVAVVELDDSSHDSDHRRTTDQKKDDVLRAAGIPITRWRVKALPDDATIQVLLTPSKATVVTTDVGMSV